MRGQCVLFARSNLRRICICIWRIAVYIWNSPLLQLVTSSFVTVHGCWYKLPHIPKQFHHSFVICNHENYLATLILSRFSKSIQKVNYKKQIDNSTRKPSIQWKKNIHPWCVNHVEGPGPAAPMHALQYFIFRFATIALVHHKAILYNL